MEEKEKQSIEYQVQEWSQKEFLENLDEVMHSSQDRLNRVEFEDGKSYMVFPEELFRKAVRRYKEEKGE